MSMYEKYHQLFSALQKWGVEYILIGGYAVILYGYKRGTEDIDLFINPTEDNFEKLRNALKEIFKDETIAEISLTENLKYPVTRYYTPDGLYIDLITSFGEAFSYNDIKFKEISDESGNLIRIAEIDSLIELKKNTLREKDQIDIFYLTRKRDNDAGKEI